MKERGVDIEEISASFMSIPPRVNNLLPLHRADATPAAPECEIARDIREGRIAA